MLFLVLQYATVDILRKFEEMMIHYKSGSPPYSVARSNIGEDSFSDCSRNDGRCDDDIEMNQA